MTYTTETPAPAHRPHSIKHVLPVVRLSYGTTYDMRDRREPYGIDTLYGATRVSGVYSGLTFASER